jgi:hypothetical protein
MHGLISGHGLRIAVADADSTAGNDGFHMRAAEYGQEAADHLFAQ